MKMLKPDRDLVRPTRDIIKIERRLFFKQTLSLGALTLLSGCDITNADSVKKVLWGMSHWNDRVQAFLFNPNRLAPTYPESAITKPFPFNAYYSEEEVPQVDAAAFKLKYSEEEVPQVDAAAFKLKLGGKISDKKPWTLEQLYALPQTSQITRLVCVEGWSAIGKWGGVTFKTFLERVGADLTAKYVGFVCADNYYSSIDMPTALHPQTLLTFKFADEILPAKYGFPMRLRMPTKLGFKNPKHIMAIFVTNTYPGGYWEDQGYNWFSGL